MTTKEIQNYISRAIGAKFGDVTAESGEIETGPSGDGRFHGTVAATRYSGMKEQGALFLAIGETEKGLQIVKLCRSEVVTPKMTDLDLILLKELGIKKDAK